MHLYSHTSNRIHGKAVLPLFALLLCCAILPAGCSAGPSPAGASAVPVPESGTPASTAQASPQASLALDPDPAPLTEADKTLSVEGYGALGALADQDLSILDMLTYAVQDEYLAHGEYTAIIEAFGNQNPYSNIVRAEQTHLAFLQEVYTAYDLTFPDDTSADHVTVPENLLEAAKTGVKAEEDNIAMYKLFLTYDLPDNVSQVFTALKNGSESHLLAFQKQVDRLS